MSTVAEMIIRHEGKGPQRNNQFFPYLDSVGKLTIAYGRNLTDVGLSEQEAMYLLENDIYHAQAELRSTYPWFPTLNDARQDALTDMLFNLGPMRFAGFHDMIAALEQRDYQAAAAAMLASHWAVQVGKRAEELAAMVASGLYQNAD